MNKFKIIFLGVLSVFITYSCVTVKNPEIPQRVQLPKTYNDTLTSNDSLHKPHDFFKDTYLLSLIDTALQNNFDLLRAIQRIEYAKAGLRYSKALFMPSVGIAANAGVEKFGDYTMSGVGNFDTNLSPNINRDQMVDNPTPEYFLGLRSSWEIGLWGKYKNTKKAAYHRLLASENGKKLVQTALVANVAQHYYRLLSLDTELDIISRNLVLQQSGLENIETLKEGGRANELAVQQFNAQVLDTKSLLISKEQEVISMENALNTLLGRYPQLVDRAKDVRKQVVPPKIHIGIPSNLLFNRPDIVQAENSLIANTADLAVARAAFFPSLTINSSLGYNSFNSSLLFQPASIAYGIFAGLTSPLLNRYRVKTNWRQGGTLQMDAFYQYQNSLVTAYQEVVTNLNGIEKYEQIYKIKTEEVDALKKAVTASNELFYAGAATYLDLITVRRFVLMAELEQTNSRKEQLLYMVELYRALGGGWQ